MEVSDVDLDVPAMKKRKICDGDVKLSPALLRSHSGVVDTPESLVSPASSVSSKENYASSEPAGSLVSPASSVNSKENYAANEPAVSSASCCSRNGSSEVTESNSKSLDLDENDMEVLASTENRLTMLSLEAQAESGELESTNMQQNENSRRQLMERTPSRDEIEEFFAACEKKMFKLFREKYNFDFEKEEPLEGRYEWVQTIEGA